MLRSTALLGLVLALVLLPSELPAAALPLLRHEWDASATAAGWLVGSYQAGYVAAVLLLLPLTDRVPAGRVIVVCAVSAALAFIAFPLVARDIWSAAALRALGGAALAGVYMPGVRVVAARATPERRGMAVGAYVGAYYFSTALSLWATGSLLTQHGWRETALLLGVASGLAVPFAYIATRVEHVRPRGSARLRPSVLAQRPVLLVILAYVGHGWELYIVRGWLTYFLATLLIARGRPELAASAEAGRTAALMMGMGTVGVLAGGWLSDRVGRGRAALAIALPCGGLSLLFGWLGGVPWMLLLIVGSVYGLLLAADSGVYSTAITELPPRALIGSAQAMQAFVGFIATTIAPVAAGMLIDLGLGWGWVFGLASLGAFLAVGALLPLLSLESRAAGAAEPARTAAH